MAEKQVVPTSNLDDDPNFLTEKKKPPPVVVVSIHNCFI